MEAEEKFNPEDYIKGRGAQYNPQNPFQQLSYEVVHPEGIDEWSDPSGKTSFIEVFPKSIVNKVESPDVGPYYSMNPYQGCEHGCTYCYARNSHQYWGYSAGIEFERKILVKKNAPELLEKTFRKAEWKVDTIMLSGNTDCYQPAERKFGITRRVLEVFAKYRHPVGIITKNTLFLRDLDLLKDLNRDRLVMVNLSLNSLNESLRKVMEPRTATAAKKLEAIRILSDAGIPVNVMVAPVVPGLNSHEIFSIVKAVADAGALSVGYTMVRLNGSIGPLFTDWLRKNYPDRAGKVINQISEAHDGRLSDSRFGARMKGEGHFADQVAQQFHVARSRFLNGRSIPALNTSAFIRTDRGQLSLFSG